MAPQKAASMVGPSIETKAVKWVAWRAVKSVHYWVGKMVGHLVAVRVGTRVESMAEWKVGLMVGRLVETTEGMMAG
jgi:hypothetical protein